MRSTLAVLCLVIAACHMDAQANDLLSRRARLTVQWSATPQEQQTIERAFLSAGWPLVTWHGPTDHATLMLLLSRIQSSDTSAHVTAWSARLVDIASGNFLRHLSCTSKGTNEFPAELPRRLRRELTDSTDSTDSTATLPGRTKTLSCTEL